MIRENTTTATKQKEKNSWWRHDGKKNSKKHKEWQWFVFKLIYVFVLCIKMLAVSIK